MLFGRGYNNFFGSGLNPAINPFAPFGEPNRTCQKLPSADVNLSKGGMGSYGPSMLAPPDAPGYNAGFAPMMSRWDFYS